jgi:hypothetical protein
MKKLFFVGMLLLSQHLLIAQPLTKLLQEFSYQFVSNEGTNASAVVWHPKKKLYFTIIAGNSNFPLEAFDAKGNSKYSKPVGIDSRGLWLNGNTLEINAAGEEGWHAINFENKMGSHSLNTIVSGAYQPDFQTVGTYHKKKKAVMFFDTERSQIVFYDRKNPDKTSSLKLTLPANFTDNFNLSTIIYTGVKGYEYFLLNARDFQLFFFDEQGKSKGSVALPDDIYTSQMFRFSYANKRIFFYNTENRKWTAYKLF